MHGGAHDPLQGAHLEEHLELVSPTAPGGSAAMARPSTLFGVALEHGALARPQQKKLEADTRREAGINRGVRAICQCNADHDTPEEARRNARGMPMGLPTNREAEALILRGEPSEGTAPERRSVGDGDRVVTVGPQRLHRSDSSLSQTPPAFPTSSVTIEVITAFGRDGQDGLSLRMRWLY
jgi:hypothetical protein